MFISLWGVTLSGEFAVFPAAVPALIVFANLVGSMVARVARFDPMRRAAMMTACMIVNTLVWDNGVPEGGIRVGHRAFDAASRGRLILRDGQARLAPMTG